MPSTVAGGTTDVLKVGPMRVRHATMRLCLVLLPVWLLGAGELGRLAWNSAVPGDLERTGAVKGRDFVQFYVAGSIANEGAWHALYSVPELERAVQRFVPAAGGQIPAPAYGPQIALLFSPLSRLPYLAARWIWCAASVLLYLLAALIVMRTAGAVREHRLLAWMTVLCNPLLSVLLSTGQISVFAVIGWALAAAAFAKGRMWLFGVCLGLLIYKPPLLLGAALVLLLLGHRSALAGLVLSAAAQVAMTLPATGIEPWQEYVASLVSLSNYVFLTDTLPHQRHSLLGFFQLLPGSERLALVLYGVTGGGVLLLWLSKRRAPLMPWFPAALAATAVLLSPHLYVYDLIVLVPSFLIAGSLVATRAQQLSRIDQILLWSGYAVLLAPYSGAVAQHARIQLSTIALLIFLFAAFARVREALPGERLASVTTAAAQDRSGGSREQQGQSG